MKKLFLLSLIGLGCFAVSPANAMSMYATADTTCYVFKNNKLTTKSQCKIYVRQTGSMYINADNYSVKIPKVGVIKVINNQICESEDKCKTTHTVNGKNAVSQIRINKKDYNVLSKKQTESSEIPHSDMLNCDKTKDSKLEICTPNDKLKNNYQVPDNPPKWAE